MTTVHLTLVEKSEEGPEQEEQPLADLWTSGMKSSNLHEVKIVLLLSC